MWLLCDRRAGRTRRHEREVLYQAGNMSAREDGREAWHCFERPPKQSYPSYLEEKHGSPMGLLDDRL